MDDAADSAQGVRTDVNSGRHAVVRNDSGQYAIWPGDLTVPGGWHLVYGPAGRDDCRAHVAREWRPPGLGFPGLGSPGERGRGRAEGDGGTVPGLLRSRAAQHPDAVAVVADDATLSYRELDRRSDRLARALRARGAGPEQVVPVCLERGAGLVVAWLGVLKAGAALLPLDPAYPARRLARLVEDSGARVAVTEGGALPGVEPVPVDAEDGPDGGGEPVLAGLGGAGGPDGAGEPDGAGPDGAGVPDGAAPDDLAYLIYTSGTTGTPKGVPVTHRALVFTLDRVVHAYGLAPGERVLQLAALGFDTALEQVFATLLAGATLVLGGGRTWAPTELVHRMRGLGLAVADLTPAYWHHVLTLLPPGGPARRGCGWSSSAGTSCTPTTAAVAWTGCPASGWSTPTGSPRPPSPPRSARSPPPCWTPPARAARPRRCRSAAHCPACGCTSWTPDCPPYGPARRARSTSAGPASPGATGAPPWRPPRPSSPTRTRRCPASGCTAPATPGAGGPTGSWRSSAASTTR